MAIREFNRPLAHHFYRMTGIHPRGQGALEIAFDDVATKGIEVLTEGWPFRTRIEDLFGRVRAWLAPCSVQILRSAEPLLIGDAPAVATAAGRTRVGTAVGLLHADEIVLPLTPGCAARLSASDSGQVGYRDIGNLEAAQLNALQIANAYRHLYWRPGDPLGPFAQMNLSMWQRPASVESLRQAVLALHRR